MTLVYNTHTFHRMQQRSMPVIHRQAMRENHAIVFRSQRRWIFNPYGTVVKKHRKWNPFVSMNSKYELINREYSYLGIANKIVQTSSIVCEFIVYYFSPANQTSQQQQQREFIFVWKQAKTNNLTWTALDATKRKKKPIELNHSLTRIRNTSTSKIVIACVTFSIFL